MTDICNQCGREFEEIGIHWSKSECEYPSFTEKQIEVITGLVMGDGCIGRASKNPRLEVGMVSKEYLEYVSDMFEVLGYGVSLLKTSKEQAASVRKNGINKDAKMENYSKYIRF